MTQYFALVVLAFCCELLDSALGGGYGTIIVPILLLAGYPRAEAVAAILFSETLTGFLAAREHHRLGNAEFRPTTLETRAAVIIGVLAALGSVVSVVCALEIDKRLLNGYIGLLIVGIGIYLIVKHFRRVGEAGHVQTWKLAALGFWAGANKGVSGGGFGPLVTGALAAAGLTRRAMAITSLAEGITSLAGLVTTALCVGLGGFNWSLTLVLSFGALCSVTLAAYIVQRLPLDVLRPLVGLAVIALGLALVVKVLK